MSLPKQSDGPIGPITALSSPSVSAVSGHSISGTWMPELGSCGRPLLSQSIKGMWMSYVKEIKYILTFITLQ